MSERRSKFPPRVIDGVDVNEAGHRAAEQALVEIEALKTSAERFRALIEEMGAFRDAGAQLPLDLLDKISTAMDEVLVEFSKRDTPAGFVKGGSP